jgi:tRNA(Ile)-lysidine synthase
MELAQDFDWSQLAGRSARIAYSGGLDSTVLLHLASLARAQHGFALSACHVHHGLQPEADAWSQHCLDTARALDVACTLVRVQVPRRSGEGIEAAARRLRYAALMTPPVDVLLLAQHADDQAETVLLQWLRGAGPRGLAAMPAVCGRGAAAVYRPLLGNTRAQIAAYAQAHALRWIEDLSNGDPRFARNYLRSEIMPRLAARFPGSAKGLARSARHLAESAQMLAELARLDLGGTLPTPAEGLALAPIAALAEHRQRNVLRHVLSAWGADPPPSEDRLKEMARQVFHARSDASICIAHGRWQVRRYRGRLFLAHAPDEVWTSPLPWRGATRVVLAPHGGEVRFDPAVGQGIATPLCDAGEWRFLRRAPRMRWQRAPGAPSHSLKQHWQVAALPPWLRSRAPLLYCGETLVWCAGSNAIALPFQAAAGKPGLLPRWLPDGPTPPWIGETS